MDLSGNGHDATLNNDVEGVFNNVSPYVTFPGAVNDYASAGTGFANFQKTDPFTICHWFTKTGTASVASISKNTTLGWVLSERTGALYFGLYAEGGIGGYSAYVVGPYNNGKWYHVACSYDGSQSWTGIRIRVNGAETSENVQNNTNPGTQPDANVIFGGRDNAESRLPWVGKLDDILIYNRVLSLEEIQKIYWDTKH